MVCSDAVAAFRGVGFTADSQRVKSVTIPLYLVQPFVAAMANLRSVLFSSLGSAVADKGRWWVVRAGTRREGGGVMAAMQ
jgi:hypothetical protein